MCGLVTFLSAFFLISVITGFNKSLSNSLVGEFKRQCKRVVKNDNQFATRDYIVYDTISHVERYGYPAEEHRLFTSDGYRLRIFRIPGSPLSQKFNGKQIVFLQHGILWSSDAFVLMGPTHDLSFMLADAGYDVWLGNVRGNTYCKAHQHISPNSSDFWDFSYHEMGTQDLPAMIDYVLGITKQKSLYYVGHSMGATMAYVMLSLKPEYNMKIKLLISLAPVAFWRHQLNPSQNLFTHIGITLLKMFKLYNLNEILPQTTILSQTANKWCREDVISHVTCLNTIFAIVGEDREQLNVTLLPYLLSYYPAGTSLRTIIHFHQNVLSGQFQLFDFKSQNNLLQYKQKEPPSYPLWKIELPVALIYGKNDAIVTAAEIQELKMYLKNVTILEAVPFEKFNHMDFMWATDVKELLYKRILQLVQQY